MTTPPDSPASSVPTQAPDEVPAAPEPGGLQAAVARKGSFLQTFRAVAWSFIGMRRSADYERDVAQLNPVHVIIAGVIGAAMFVGALVLLVQWVVSSGVAK